MISLNECKARIFQTEYKDYVCEGFCCSEPILTQGEKGLIDNFIVYSRNRERTTFSPPRAVFGIYAEEGVGAYRMEDIPIDHHRYTADAPGEIPDETYERYVSLYPMIRQIAFTTCDVESRERLRQYLQDLEKIVGPVIWKFYQVLFPTFFDWAYQQLHRMD